MEDYSYKKVMKVILRKMVSFVLVAALIGGMILGESSYRITNVAAAEVKTPKLEVQGIEFGALSMAEGAVTADAEMAKAGSDIYPEWVAGVNYVKGDLTTYQGKIYECINPHTSMVTWEPANVPALWKECTDTENRPGEVTTEAETETKSEIKTEAKTETKVQEETTIHTGTTMEGGIEINGYQVSTIREGFRTIYSVSIPEENLAECGLIYGLSDYAVEADMVVNSSNRTVYNFPATNAGKTPVCYSNLSGAVSYAMTMKFIKQLEFYRAKIMVRGYARLKDGNYVYSECATTSVYAVADYLYRKGAMTTPESHTYLYDNILSVVNPQYPVVDFNWSGTIIKPSEEQETKAPETETTKEQETINASNEVPTNIGDKNIEEITGNWTLAENGYSYSGAGYQGGSSISEIDRSNVIDLTTMGVIANDGIDDTAALQAAIDSLKGVATAENHYVLQLPAGEIIISDEIHVDVDGIILRGKGNNVDKGGTKITFKPWKVYGVVDGEPQIDGKLWPGYAAFRIQTREKAAKDTVYEGSVNFHWISGVKTRSSSSSIPNETAGGRQGDNKVYLSNVSGFAVGDSVLVLGCNTEKFLTETNSCTPWRNEHARNQMLTVTAVNQSEKSLTLDKPLEFDLPYSNEGKIENTTWYSKVVKLKTVSDIGFENFCMETTLEGTEYENLANSGIYNAITNPNGVAYRYQNAAPEYAISSFMFKWAENCWMDGVRINMSASHPIVTEFARHLTIQNNFVDGAWNKGKGGHGYVRMSKAYDCIVRNNDIRRVRHLALQWSATGNLILNNYLTCDINLHGGWERNNWIEGNKSELPYEHRSWNLEGPENETWYNIWWGSGAHAGDWSTASGYNNVLYNNEFYKQETEGGTYNLFRLYSNKDVIHIGWDGSQWKHLAVNGVPISTWGPHVWTDFSSEPNEGVYIEKKEQENIIYCSTVSELKNALENVEAGQTIKLKPGVYELLEAEPVGLRSAYFYGTADGTENNKIILESEDPENPATLKGGTIDTAGYVLYITGDYWEIKNLKVTYGQKGIMLDNSNYTRIYGCEVYETGQEGVHLRDGSSNCTVEEVYVHDTGATATSKDMGFGEGIYVGSDRSMWDVNEGTAGSKAEIGYGYNRKVWNTHILNCTIGSNVTAECIDIKEGTSGTVIEGCTFLGGGTSLNLFADSFIDVKGINVTIKNNVGYKENNPNLSKTIAEVKRTYTSPWCPAEETSNGKVNDTSDGNIYINNIFYDGNKE